MQEGLEDLHWELDARWKDLGITLEWICERANWLHRDAGAPGNIDRFFKAAGRLMRLCAYDYLLLGPMFFHDGLFPEIPPFLYGFGKELDGRIRMPRHKHIEKLALLLPDLRNAYFHGRCSFLSPDLLHMALQVREMADALTMQRTPEWKVALQVE